MRGSTLGTASLLFAAAVTAPASIAQWIEFVDETATRLVAQPSLGAADTEEKTYAWADFDQDGDVDLAVARKQAWYQPGKRPNVLLMNQDGVLTDRTGDYATASDVFGDLGFHTPTSDRHIVAVDVDLDGWIDLVTATTLSQTSPKHIGHPRVYRNLGCTGGCTAAEWLGFRYEEARIPTLLSASGQTGHNPCFNHVAAGDVTGDGYPELWFKHAQGPSQCGGAAAFNNTLLINAGAANPGFFTDGTLAVSNAAFVTSGIDDASGPLADVNGDGTNDLMKQSDGAVTVAYSDSGQGSFSSLDTPYSNAIYFANTAELNNDDRLDLILTNDGTDKYLLNQGSGPDGIAEFLALDVSYVHLGGGAAATDDGFGGNNISADLDGDGWQDVLITDVDFTVSGCSRRMHIYRNLGGTSGGVVQLREQTTGLGCSNPEGNPPSCRVASIPADRLEGAHDVAVFDIDGDDRLDLVVGRCTGTQVYMNQALVGAGGVPDGDTAGETMLTVAKVPNSTRIALEWGASCDGQDTDYVVYQGLLDGSFTTPFTTHAPVGCSTHGFTSASFEPALGNRYYLVVPTNGEYEGSYGFASDGTPRDQGIQSCFPMLAAGCE